MTKIRVAFNTEQDIKFLKWLKTTQYKASMTDIDAGYDPDYATGVYYAWFTWELDEAVLEEYVHTSVHGTPQLAWEQLELDLE